MCLLLRRSRRFLGEIHRVTDKVDLRYTNTVGKLACPPQDERVGLQLGMMFWSVLVAGLFALSVVLGGWPTLDMLQDGNPVRLIYATVFLTGTMAALSLRLLLRGGRRTLGHVGLWLVLATAGSTVFAYQDDLRLVVQRMQGELIPSMAVATQSGEVELRRAWDGHYRADTLVNGSETRLLIDTGASMVLIPYEEAPGLGFPHASLDFSLPVTTANGRSTVAPVKIASMQIGPIHVNNVSAAVAQPGTLKDGLLGMSFLDHLYEISFQRDKLFLRQRAVVPMEGQLAGASDADADGGRVVPD